MKELNYTKLFNYIKDNRLDLAETIKQLSANGKSIRDIANDLRISKSKVGRILKM